MNQYAKFIAAVVVTVLSAAAAALTDGRVTTVEWVNIAIAGVNAIAVVVVPNLPAGSGLGTYSKAAVTALSAVLTALVGFLAFGQITPSEILQLAIIAFGAIGVWAVPNAAPSPVARPLGS